MRSNDTLQELDYAGKLPFNVFWQPKEIVGTDPRAPIYKRDLIVDEQRKAEVIKSRPREYVSPGISLDNVTDPETRKKMIDFTYTTSVAQAAKEVWRNFNSEKKAINSVFNSNSVRFPVSSRLPALSTEIRSAAKKWDAEESRVLAEESPRKQGFRNEKYVDYGFGLEFIFYYDLSRLYLCCNICNL